MASEPNVVLGSRFLDALAAASAWHRDQGRKGSNSPYLGHLLAVAAIVIDAGGSEDLAIAALLHDAIEDQPVLSGGEAGICKRFGEHVASIVKECSDSDPDGGPLRDASNWRARKEAYVKSLLHKSPEALLVSLADKVHNARAIRLDLATHGAKVWTRFNASQKDQLLYYSELAKAFGRCCPGPLATELAREVADIERLSANVS